MSRRMDNQLSKLAANHSKVTGKWLFRHIIDILDHRGVLTAMKTISQRVGSWEKCQEDSMYEQGAPGQNQTQNQVIGGIQKRCLSLQG